MYWFSKEKPEILMSYNNGIKLFVKTVMNFYGCIAFYLHSNAFHTHHAKCMHMHHLPGTAIKYNARRNLDIFKSNHFRVDKSVVRKDCQSCLIIDSDPLFLTIKVTFSPSLPFPSLS